MDNVSEIISTKDRRFQLYHICTDGAQCGIIYQNDEDFKHAMMLTAVCAHKSGIQIICFVHMATHSHFVIMCRSREEAVRFINRYKQMCSRYLQAHYGASRSYRQVKTTIKLIEDSWYAKSCISYVLLNPVAARIVRRFEDYKWSSFKAYFNGKGEAGKPIGEFNYREKRAILQSHESMDGSSLRINPDGSPILQSFVNHEYVENLFRGKTEFFRSLIKTDYLAEDDKYAEHTVKYSDNDLMAEALKYAKDKFCTESIHLLTKKQKMALLQILHYKAKATSSRIARVLHLSKSEVNQILGE